MTEKPDRPAKRIVDVVELQNLRCEVSSRDVQDREGKTRVYFDVDFTRSYQKDGETILTKTFQYRDLDRLLALVGMAKNKISELLREQKSKDREDPGE